jgi:hypothetical protein
VDAVTCGGIAKSVEEDGGIGGAVVDEGNQRVCSGWPEWAATYCAAPFLCVVHRRFNNVGRAIWGS